MCMRTRKCGILGATGTVGQRFITLLSFHPYFKVVKLGASSRSAGRIYSQAAKWKLEKELPEDVSSMLVYDCKPEHFQDCDVVFSALDAEVAGEIELEFIQSGLRVFSNAKNHRMQPDVPLIVPLANTQHLSLLQVQQEKRSLPPTSFIVTNSNCSTAGIVVPLAALQSKFGELECLSVVTLQAISGAGYPGLPSLDIIGNIIPFIPGEEEKIGVEVNKILGTAERSANIKTSVQCNRVPVVDGHTSCLSLRFRSRPPPSITEIKAALSLYICEAQEVGCPSAPLKVIHVMEEADRPQPRIDRDVENGYAVSVGRIRQDDVFDVKMVVLVHNTVLGAAGSGILNAEVCVHKGLM